MFRSVGSGTGPTTFAPVRWTCSTMSRAATSSIRGSYARSLMRIFVPAMGAVSRLLHDLGDPPGADGAAAFPDREPKAVFHGDRVDQLHGHLDVVTGHHHPHPTGEVGGAGHVGGAEVELGPVAVEERGVAATFFLG